MPITFDDNVLTKTIIDRSIDIIWEDICEHIGEDAFRNCTAFTMAKFKEVKSIDANAFAGSTLEALILPSSTMCTLSNANAFDNTPIANGTGYIYVPSALVNTYKGNSVWSIYSDRFRTIEDYPMLCNDLGKIWKPSNLTQNARFYDVCYVDGLWVATSGSYKGLYYSEDGKTWTQSNITSGSQYEIAYHNGLWVAGGIYYSEDGKVWTPCTTNATSMGYVAYLNGLWLKGGNMYYGIYYSEDGKTWTQSNITDKMITQFLYIEGKWWANGFGGSYISEDGKTWTTSSVGSQMNIGYNDGLWVAGSTNNGGWRYSEDGQTWKYSNITNETVSVPQYAGNLWLSGVKGGTLYYSEDGKTWSACDSPTASIWGDVVFVDGLWVAGSTVGVCFSRDGKTWVQCNMTNDFLTLCVANGMIVAGSNDVFGLHYSVAE